MSLSEFSPYLLASKQLSHQLSHLPSPILQLERYKTYARILERHLALQFAQPGAATAGALPALADAATTAPAAVRAAAAAAAAAARTEENGGPMAPGAAPPGAGPPMPGAAHDPKAAAMVLRNQNAVYEII